jgi:hypothetical protein
MLFRLVDALDIGSDWIPGKRPAADRASYDAGVGKCLDVLPQSDVAGWNQRSGRSDLCGQKDGAGKGAETAGRSDDGGHCFFVRQAGESRAESDEGCMLMEKRI